MIQLNNKPFLLFMVLLLSLYNSSISINTTLDNDNDNNENNAIITNESTSDSSLLVPTFAPTTSTIPSNTAYPTFEDVCYICGSATNEILNPNQTVVVFEDNSLFYCKELQMVALNRQFDLFTCSLVQNAGCNCTQPFTPKTFAPTPTITWAPTISPYPTITSYPTYEDVCYLCGSESNELLDPNQTISINDPNSIINGFIFNCSGIQAEALANRKFLDPVTCARYQNFGCNCTKPFTPPNIKDMIPTFAPTTTFPPSNTGAPSYEDICYVCGSATKEISNPSQTVIVGGTLLTCGELQVAGLYRYLDSLSCSVAQQVGCNCTYTPTPSPTITQSPSYEDKCYICGNVTNEILNPNQIVTVFDSQYYCSEIQKNGLSRKYDSNICKVVQQAGCNCTTPFIPPIIMSPASIALWVPTFAPNTSSYPSITSYPSYQDICYVCDNDATKEISNPNQTILMFGLLFFCSDVQEEGLKRQFDSDTCQVAQQAGCNCTTTSLRTPSPTSLRLLSPTSSLHPSSQPASIPKDTSPTATSNNTSSQPTSVPKPMNNTPLASTSNSTINSNTNTTSSSTPQHMASGNIVMFIVFSLILSIIY